MAVSDYFGLKETAFENVFINGERNFSDYRVEDSVFSFMLVPEWNGHREAERVFNVRQKKKNLKYEIGAVRKCFKGGISKRDLGRRFNRSVTWVNSRLDNRLRPKFKGLERSFVDVVKKNLLARGFVVPPESFYPSGAKRGFEAAVWDSPHLSVGGRTSRPDLFLYKEGVLYLFEVKYEMTAHNMERGLGQCVWNKFISPNSKVVLVIPTHLKDKGNIVNDGEFLKYMKEKYDIDVWFINDDDYGVYK